MCDVADPSSPAGLPAELWHDVLLLCDVKTLLNLESTCRFFLGRLKDRSLWLTKLQELGKDHAPDLPTHMSINSLSMADLRDIVTRAERRYMNCMGPEPLKATRRTTIPIGESNADGTLGTPIVWGADTLLLPGKKYFLTKWPAGYLQCWNTETKGLEWTYPRMPELGQVQDGAVVSFAVDMLSDGNVHVAIVCEALASPDQRHLRILRFDTSTGILSQIYDAAPTELDVWHGMPFFLHIAGDICIVYTEGQLMVSEWRKDRFLVVEQAILDFSQIVDDLIIGVKNTFEGNGLFAIPIAPLLKRLEEDGSSCCHVNIEDIPIVECRITSPRHWLLGRAQLSICKFHWKKTTTRQYSVTVFADVFDEDQSCDFPVAMVFNLSMDEPPSTRDLLGGISSISLADGTKLEGMTMDNMEAPLPTITLVDRSRLEEMDYEYSTYSAMNPPAQAGSTILAFYDDRQKEKRFARTFSTFSSDMTVKLKPLDESMITTRPATYSLNVEFYSGTIYYVSDDLREAVLLSID